MNANVHLYANIATVRSQQIMANKQKQYEDIKKYRI